MKASLPENVDVAIVGAGTAGAATALACARRGLRTLCLDRRALDRAGARWVNGVTGESFDRAGIARPEGAERMGSGDPFHLIAGWGPRRITIRDHDVPEVDMRLLVERLQSLAREAGATFAGDVTVKGLGDDGLETASGSVRARWIVDASGLTGAKLLDPPRVARRDICAAAQSVLELKDERAARAFWDQHEAPYGQNLCFTGVAGGYSIVNVAVHGNQVSILTGSIPGEGHPSGEVMLRRFVEEHGWIGDAIFGGSRAIPIRRPFDRLTDGRVIAIGDAASMVFPAHGSGIGAGMVAGRQLADALADGDGPHRWAARWQRTEGALFASYDVFRRFSQTMRLADLEVLMATGLMDEGTARAGKAQVPPSLAPSAIPAKLKGLVEARGLGARLVTVLAKMGAVRALYLTYPEDPKHVPAWSRVAARIFGDPSDFAEGSGRVSSATGDGAETSSAEWHPVT